MSTGHEHRSEEKQGAGREEGHVENMNKHSWASESQERLGAPTIPGLLPEPSPVHASARASQVGSRVGMAPPNTDAWAQQAGAQQLPLL